MFAGGAKLAGVLGVSMAALLFGGAAGAESAKTPAARSAEPPTQETGVQQGGAALEGGVVEPREGGSQLKETQAQMDVAASRIRELDLQTRSLSRDLEAQREATKDSKARFEERIRAAYKGENLAGISLVLDGLLSGDSARLNAVLNSSLVRVLIQGRGSIQFHQDSQRALEETSRQLAQKKADYERELEEQRARAEELRRREAKLEVSLGKSGSKKEQMEARIAQLQAAEEAGEFTRPPASGGGGDVMPDQELEIASEDIVARPVGKIPYERYVQIYKASARRYGFAEDWYVLAAVGKVESNHGENMGPSSAGAMGPMQFLPSTWKQYGVDGNRDGEANIMDPEDAIPAAASYLKFGGAPEDWYAALYTYNRAGWYVRQVLGTAEAYRRQAADDEVKPYV